MRVPEPREHALTKVCACCDTRKTWAEFRARRFWEDGSVRWVQSWCLECERVADRRSQRWRKRDLAQRRAQWAARQRMVREDRGAHVLLPVSPFKEWLDRRVAAGEELGLIADRAGVPDRALRRVRSGEHDRVSLDTVDRVLLDANERVEDLYPELERAA